MSHFTVCVIGDDHAKLLEPYDENRAVDPYPEDITDDELRLWQESEHSGGLRTSSDLRAVLDSLQEWFGGKITYDRDRDTYVRWSTYNPHSRWDWWVVGGRWSGYWLLKADADPGDVDHSASERSAVNAPNRNPERADRARQRAIDLEEMMKLGIAGALDWWDRADHVLAPHGGLVAIPAPPDRGAGREAFREWWNHPTLKALHEHGRDERGAPTESSLLGLMEDPFGIYGRVQMGRTEWAAYRGQAATVPYAVLHAEGWVAPGEMGWFGMSTDTFEDQVEFTRRMHELIMDDELAGEWFTLVDCHI